MILIVTNKEDITVDFVVDRLTRETIPFHRFNTEEYPGRYSISVKYDQEGEVATISAEEFSLPIAEVSACWYRRPGTPAIDNSIADKGLREFALSESLAMLEGLYRLLEGKWLNDPGAIRLAESKVYQLHLARSLGFSIPDSLIASDSRRVRDFVQNHGEQTIAKPLNTPTYGNGENDSVLFTSQIKLAHLDDEFSVESAPFILQQRINKAFDLRVTVVGDQFFPAEIHSQEFEETSIDWRKGQRVDLHYAEHRLTPDMESKCVRLVRRLGLRFGAIDLVVDNSGRYWFLEINPNGQWAWIEQRLGFDISGAIVRELQLIGGRNVERG